MKENIQTIQIFFSWQSDLPYQKTTKIIEAALNNLKELYSGSVEIIIDKDMRNTLGMLDISEEILSKIENADIFVADLSIVSNYHKLDKGIDKQKSLSNPNVLFELGYAASIVTWNYVASVANTDFGDVDNQPFDINHRSISKFSLEHDGVEKAIKATQNYINRYIINLIQNGKRIKKDSTFYEIGSFDFNSNSFVKRIDTYKINDKINMCLQSLKEDIKKTIEVIESLKILRYDKIKFPEPDNQIIEGNKYLKSILGDNPFRNLVSEPVSVAISNEVRFRILSYCEKNGINVVEDDFFFLGCLKTKTKVHIAGFSSGFDGSDTEIKKYNAINKLDNQILYYDYLVNFFKMFEDVNFLAVALKNVSPLSDENISVIISIDGVELVSLSDSLSDEEKGLFETVIMDDALMESIFRISSNSFIFSNYDKWPALFPYPDVYSKTQKYSADDIGKVIDWYFAKPDCESYSFYIDSMNSNDVCWIGPLILFKGDLSKCKLKCIVRGKNMKNQQIYDKNFCDDAK